MDSQKGTMICSNGHLLPVGFRFMPTDQELVKHYLMNKVFSRVVPAAGTIQEIDATKFYSGHPKNLVTFSCGERDWFFFIHEDHEDCSQRRRDMRVVGNGVGFWKPNGPEYPIYNEDGEVFAFKIFLTYFSGSLPQAKRTHWKMVEYCLNFESTTKGKHQRKECKLGRIQRGTDHNSF